MAGTPLIFRPLARYADFQGRSRRAELWGFLVMVWVLTLALYAWVFQSVFALFGKPGAVPDAAMFGNVLLAGAITLVFALAIMVPTLAVQVRRLHDSNRTGWWLLLPMAGSTIGQTVLYTFRADEIMRLTMAMTPAMQSAAGDGFDVTKIWAAEWPLYQFTLPYTMIPSLIAYIVLLVFFFWPGTRGDNRFGANPRPGS